MLTREPSSSTCEREAAVWRRNYDARRMTLAAAATLADYITATVPGLDAGVIEDPAFLGAHRWMVRVQAPLFADVCSFRDLLSTLTLANAILGTSYDVDHLRRVPWIGGS